MSTDDARQGSAPQDAGLPPVRIEGFEGPLDLLVFLVRKNEIPIEEVPICRIVEQYLEYLDLTGAVNVEEGGDFIAWAATLVHWKSCTLIPGDEEPEEDEPGEEGEIPLAEYLRLKEAARRLESREILNRDVFSRDFPPEELRDTEEEPVRLSLFDLLVAFRKIVERVASGPSLSVPEHEYTVEQKIEAILQHLRGCGACGFARLFETRSRKELIVTFLALLELIRMGLVRVYGDGSHDRIRVVLQREETGEGSVPREKA